MNGIMLELVARDGERREFDPARIEKAVEKAFAASGTSAGQVTPESIAREVTGMAIASGRSEIGIEEVQDLVENRLVHHRLYEAAKSYMLYRSKHESIRKVGNLVLDIEKTMEGYLGRDDWRVNENANVNFSLGGLILHNSGTLTAHYWLNNIYSPEVARAHREVAFHIHDLGMFSGYCAGWSLRQLIEEGLGGVAAKISSKPARHLHTLIQQMVNFLGIMQNEWAGAQAFSSVDTYIAPFVKADKLDYRAVKQAIQSFVFGVNTPSRWGSQAPFTNITMDWVVPEDLADKPAVVGGEPADFTYGDCQVEMDLVNRAFIEVMLEGDADGRGFQYPIPTYNITKKFVWDSPNAELLFRMTAKYGTPYFQNFVNSDLNPGDVRSMCCRLQLDKRELRKRGGGLFGSDEFTGSIGVVTINLPQIAFLADGPDDFYRRLDSLMDLAKESLETKRKVVQKLLDDGLFPYTKRYLKHLNNHFSTIGLVGMNEAVRNLLGCDLREEEGRAFSLDVLNHMRERIATYQEETGNLYNLEASPAESTSYRLARADVARYPGILTAGTPEAPYYTNSSQLPVDTTTDIFDALDHQEALQTRYTGGTVFHGFLGESIKDWKTCASLVRIIAGTYRIPYFTITPTFSICATHGYIDGEVPVCKDCGQKTEVYSRIVGYYRSLENWNIGKKREFVERVEFEGRVPAERDVQPAAESIAAAPIATAEMNVDEPQTSANSNLVHLQVFVSPSCPKCPSVLGVLADAGLPFEQVDATTEQGGDLAQRYGVYSVPAVIACDTHGIEIWRETDPATLRRHLAQVSQSAYVCV